MADLHPISVYHLFTGPVYHIVFSPVRAHWNFRLWMWSRTFFDIEIRNLAEAPRLIFTTQDCWFLPLKYVSDILQTEKALTVEEYKHKHTHTYTHTHTHTHIHTHLSFKKNFRFGNKKVRYETNLPFIDYSELWPGNYNLAKHRLSFLKNKLNNNKDLFNEFDTITKHYIIEDHVQIVPPGEEIVLTGSTHYLPQTSHKRQG